MMAEPMTSAAVPDVLVETTGRKRDRAFAYQRYLDRLRVETDLDVTRRATR